MKKKFDLSKVIDNSVAMARRVNESQEPPIEYIDTNDMLQDLQKYTYALFAEDRAFKKFDKMMEDFEWSEDVCTVDVRRHAKKPGKFIICMNTFFAEYLLDRQAAIFQGDWNFNEDMDRFPSKYYALFRAALLYAVGIALVKSTDLRGVGEPEAYLKRYSNSYGIALNEIEQSYPQYSADFMELRKILQQFIKI